MDKYIKLDDAITTLHKYFPLSFDRQDAEDDLKSIPAADVQEVRRGYWKEDGDIQICSECGEEHCWADYRAPYCETCGAKMIGEMQYKMLYHSAFPDGKESE